MSVNNRSHFLNLSKFSKSNALLAGLLIALLSFAILSVGIGAVSIEPSVVLKIFANKLGFLDFAEDELVQSSAIIYSIRLPRVILHWRILHSSEFLVDQLLRQLLLLFWERNCLAFYLIIYTLRYYLFQLLLEVLSPPSLCTLFQRVPEKQILPQCF